MDAGNEIGASLGARVVPNGLLVDAGGEIAWGRIGGFSVDRPEDTDVVAAWLAGQDLPPSAIEPADALRGELVATHMRLGRVLLAQGAREGALGELRRALALDPDSFIVRKQIWMIRFPEKFHPSIDLGWQKEQLARERAEEAACGPDGCALPGTVAGST